MWPGDQVFGGLVELRPVLDVHFMITDNNTSQYIVCPLDSSEIWTGLEFRKKIRVWFIAIHQMVLQDVIQPL